MKYFILFLFVNLYSFAIAKSNTDVFLQIRKNLPSLKDSPTGAIDANGNYTKDEIQGLNCAGFVKWVVDGFYMPLQKANNETELYMSLEKLREKHPTERGNEKMLSYENSREPYFGLDWTRNLAVELGKIRGEETSYRKYDVTDSTVSKYTNHCGYPTYLIEKVLIEQSKKNANCFYLGSLNGFYGNPKIWQHYHVALFIPYEENGKIKIAVLERNKETSFSYLLKRYPNTYCHLVKISAEGDFELMSP